MQEKSPSKFKQTRFKGDAGKKIATLLDLEKNR